MLPHGWLAATLVAVALGALSMSPPYQTVQGLEKVPRFPLDHTFNLASI
jgi:hypothetical protein